MAQLIPNRNLFIVTSALHANIGIVNDEDRYKQTIQTLQNLREKVPNAIVIFSDGSSRQVEDEKFKEIAKYVNGIAPWTFDPDVFAMASSGRKSEAEIIMLFKMLVSLKQNPDLMKMMHSVKRIFKYSARSLLDDDFDINEYDNLYGKYVFKKALPSWMSEERKRNITDHLYITRMYSFCPSLIDNYMQTLQLILNNVIQHGIDTEHSHYLCLDKRHVVEFDKVKCSGIVAGSGETEKY